MGTYDHECVNAYSNDILGNPKIIYMFFKEKKGDLTTP